VLGQRPGDPRVTTGFASIDSTTISTSRLLSPSEAPPWNAISSDPRASFHEISDSGSTAFDADDRQLGRVMIDRKVEFSDSGGFIDRYDDAVTACWAKPARPFGPR
jgi:hypothetical protein